MNILWKMEKQKNTRKQREMIKNLFKIFTFFWSNNKRSVGAFMLYSALCCGRCRRKEDNQVFLLQNIVLVRSIGNSSLLLGKRTVCWYEKQVKEKENLIVFAAKKKNSIWNFCGDLVVESFVQAILHWIISSIGLATPTCRLASCAIVKVSTQRLAFCRKARLENLFSVQYSKRHWSVMSRGIDNIINILIIVILSLLAVVVYEVPYDYYFLLFFIQLKKDEKQREKTNAYSILSDNRGNHCKIGDCKQFQFEFEFVNVNMIAMMMLTYVRNFVSFVIF